MNALSTRLAGADDKEWKKIMKVKGSEKPKKKTTTKADHMKNMQAIRGLR